MALLLYRAYLLTILSIACQVASQNQNPQTCYWPSGQIAPADQVPCSIGVSQCCSINSACLSNGLCFSATSGTVRTQKVLNGTCCEAKVHHRSIAAVARLSNGELQNVLHIAMAVREGERWRLEKTFDIVCRFSKRYRQSHALSARFKRQLEMVSYCFHAMRTLL